MARISDLTRATGPMVSSDLIGGYPQVAQDDQAFTAGQLLAFVQANLTSNLALAQQFASPSATAFNVAIVSLAVTPNTWLILTPTGTFAAGTITLPANPIDGQIVSVNCTQIVTTLTVAGNGRTVTGAPTTLAANAFFELRYSATLSGWYRTG